MMIISLDVIFREFTRRIGEFNHLLTIDYAVIGCIPFSAFKNMLNHVLTHNNIQEENISWRRQ
jgi:hypothetical protein